MKTFKINKSAQIVADTYGNSRSWGHKATLLIDGEDVAHTKIRYYNRTWERFEYEDVLRKVLTETKQGRELLGKDYQEKVKKLLDGWAKDSNAEFSSMFNTIAMVAKMGEILTDDKKSANDWKARMIKAGLGEGISMPDDWDSLSEDEKEKRLNKTIEFMSKKENV